MSKLTCHRQVKCTITNVRPSTRECADMFRIFPRAETQILFQTPMWLVNPHSFGRRLIGIDRVQTRRQQDPLSLRIICLPATICQSSPEGPLWTLLSICGVSVTYLDPTKQHLVSSEQGNASHTILVLR